MRILIAGYFIARGQVGGAEQSVYDLTHGLLDLGHDVTFLCQDPARIDLSFRSSLDASETGRLLTAGGPRSRFLLEQRMVADASLRADLTVFPNYFTPIFLPDRLGHILTVIHDLQYRHHPENWPLHKRLWLRAAHGMTLARADTVVAISTTVRDDIATFHGGRHLRKVHVIPNAVSWDEIEDQPDGGPPFDGRRYILSVGAHYAHKNLSTLLHAFYQLAQHDDNVLLVLVGQVSARLHGRVRRFEAERVLGELGLGDRVRILGYVDDARLAHLYHHAALFAFPSVFEGFGRPPVEALGLGLTTVTTRRSSLPEVTLGKAWYVADPYDVAEWVTVLRSVLEDPHRYRVTLDDVEQIRRTYDRATVAQRLLIAADVDQPSAAR